MNRPSVISTQPGTELQCWLFPAGVSHTGVTQGPVGLPPPTPQSPPRPSALALPGRGSWEKGFRGARGSQKDGSQEGRGFRGSDLSSECAEEAAPHAHLQRAAGRKPTWRPCAAGALEPGFECLVGTVSCSCRILLLSGSFWNPFFTPGALKSLSGAPGRVTVQACSV